MKRKVIPVLIGLLLDAAKKYKNAKLVQIPGDTHCYDEHLDQVTAAVKKFLGEMENREG